MAGILPHHNIIETDSECAVVYKKLYITMNFYQLAFQVLDYNIWGGCMPIKALVGVRLNPYYLTKSIDFQRHTAGMTAKRKKKKKYNPLKLISSPHCALSRVCLRLLFVSCKMSQNVAIRIYLHEVNSKFHVNRHYRYEALCFILSDILLDENLHSCKNQ